MKFSEGCDLFYFTRKNKLLQGVPSQHERSLPVEINAITKRLNVQDVQGLKDAYFAISSAKKLSVIREIPVGRKSIPILVPTFWSYCSSKNIYEKTLHPDHNLLRHYAFHGSYPK